MMGVTRIDELIDGAACQCTGQVGVHTELDLHILHARDNFKILDPRRAAGAETAHQTLAAQGRNRIPRSRQGRVRAGRRSR